MASAGVLLVPARLWAEAGAGSAAGEIPPAPRGPPAARWLGDTAQGWGQLAAEHSRTNLPGEGGEPNLRSRPAGGCWPWAGSVRGWQGGRGPLALRQWGRRAQRPEGDRELREPRIALASPRAAGPRHGTAKYGPTPEPAALLYPEGFAILPGAWARLRVGAAAVTPPAPAPSRPRPASPRGLAGSVQPCAMLGSPMPGWLPESLQG